MSAAPCAGLLRALPSGQLLSLERFQQDSAGCAVPGRIRLPPDGRRPNPLCDGVLSSGPPARLHVPPPPPPHPPPARTRAQVAARRAFDPRRPPPAPCHKMLPRPVAVRPPLPGSPPRQAPAPAATVPPSHRAGPARRLPICVSYLPCRGRPPGPGPLPTPFVAPRSAPPPSHAPLSGTFGEASRSSPPHAAHGGRVV